MNEVVGSRDRELRVTEATGDRNEVTPPFLCVSVSPETRIIMHLERSLHEQGGVSVCTVVYYHVCHSRCVLDTPFNPLNPELNPIC